MTRTPDNVPTGATLRDRWVARALVAAASLVLTLSLASAIVTLSASTARAHHSWAEFDDDRHLVVGLTVDKLAWEEPHAWFVGHDQSGRAYKVWLSGPSRNIALGLQEGDLAPGTVLKASLHPHLRNGTDFRGNALAVGGKLVAFRPAVNTIDPRQAS